MPTVNSIHTLYIFVVEFMQMYIMLTGYSVTTDTVIENKDEFWCFFQCRECPVNAKLSHLRDHKNVPTPDVLETQWCHRAIHRHYNTQRQRPIVAYNQQTNITQVTQWTDDWSVEIDHRCSAGWQSDNQWITAFAGRRRPVQDRSQEIDRWLNPEIVWAAESFCRFCKFRLMVQ